MAKRILVLLVLLSTTNAWARKARVTMKFDSTSRVVYTFDTKKLSKAQVERWAALGPNVIRETFALSLGFVNSCDSFVRKNPDPAKYQQCRDRLEKNRTYALTKLDKLAAGADGLAAVVEYQRGIFARMAAAQAAWAEYLVDKDVKHLRGASEVDPKGGCSKHLDAIGSASTDKDRDKAESLWRICLEVDIEQGYPENAWGTFLVVEDIDERVILPSHEED